ncbi:MAG: acyl-CoA dehydrogenase [Pseudonocardia sp.]|nr:acyl-CoA dehydrogenase [Pseudonocardia sp.]
MSSDSDLLDLAESIFADTGADLWKTLEETGLARLTLPESAGGSGGTLTDAAAVLQVAGAHAAPVPLAETDLLAAWLLHAAGLSVPTGPLTAVAGDLHVADGRVTGTLTRVPWGRTAAGIAVLTPSHVVLLTPGQVTVTEGTNLGEEPRDTVTVDADVPTTADAPAGAADELRLRAALGRAQLLAGAARGALARSVQYAGERVQFGRPIGRFQAVQQQLALAAAEVAAAGAAASAAASTAERDGCGAASTAFAVAAAKARAGESAGEVARIAHQVHGAIGVTREHDLRLLTTRLWAWRDEDGSEAYWQAQLGATVTAAGPDALWPLVTGMP